MTETIRWTPTLFEAQGGAFSSTKRYVRAVTSGGYALAAGATCTAMYTGTVGTSIYNRVTFRFNIPGVMSVYHILIDTNVTRDPGTPSPTVQYVTV